jgi:hypothetical protein
MEDLRQHTRRFEKIKAESHQKQLYRYKHNPERVQIGKAVQNPSK